MAEVKITALSAIADPASTDVLPICDVSADITHKVSIDSLLKNAAAGTAAAPAFAFDADPNTGMYRSGADALAFSTGGTGRLFIDSSGRVGIGNASPSSNGLVTITETTNARLYLADSTLGNAYGAQLRGYGTSGLGAFAELGVVDNNDYKKAITITQQAQSVIFNTGTDERMRIDSSGNVGVGTTSPATFGKFAVSGSGNQISINATTGDAKLVFFENGTGRFYLSTLNGSAGLAFVNESGVERMRIDSSGNVGIDFTPKSLHTNVTSSLNVGSSSLFQRTKDSYFSSNFYYNSSDIGKSIASGYAPIYVQNVTNGAHVWYSSTNASAADETVSISERMRIDSSGNVGIANSSPTTGRLVVGSTSDSNTSVNITSSTSGVGLLSFSDTNSGQGGIRYFHSTDHMAFHTADSERMRIDSSGRVGIGTTSPSNFLHVQNNTTGNTYAIVENTTAGNAGLNIKNANGDWNLIANAALRFVDNAVGERMRIDSSGRLLVGTTTVRSMGSGFQPAFQLEGAETVSSASFSITSNRSVDDLGPRLNFARSKGGSIPSNAAVDDNAELGGIYFWGADGTDTNSQGAKITAEVDGTPGADDMPGRLVFYTTASGASSPTERMRIASDGDVLIGKTTAGISTAGHEIFPDGALYHTASAKTAVYVNRLTNDGTLIDLRQNSTSEGSISVSGTTVSYNGAHLSRWSQLASNAARIEILRGSVLSNIDEMCEWGEEDNEQLNRMQVSNVEGDRNVAGVFQGWDDDDDTYTNDFYCAMTGDFVIRIAQGITVERGDLLMSAGDGTAKPQDDDIIRSKTIAKVTSTNVSCTYADGSYCVPCVLMAC